MLVNTFFRLWEEAIGTGVTRVQRTRWNLATGLRKRQETWAIPPSCLSFPVVDWFFFLFPYFRRKRSPGSTSTGDGDSFLKTVYSVESSYYNKNIESTPIRKEDFIIPGFPNLTTGTETWLYKVGNRELVFGTAFDLRLAATRCVPLNLALFWGTGIERRLSE